SLLDVLQSIHTNFHARSSQNHLRPDSRACMLKPPARIDQRAGKGQRSHDSRVQENQRRRHEQRSSIAESFAQSSHGFYSTIGPLKRSSIEKPTSGKATGETDSSPSSTRSSGPIIPASAIL